MYAEWTESLMDTEKELGLLPKPKVTGIIKGAEQRVTDIKNVLEMDFSKCGGGTDTHQRGTSKDAGPEDGT